MAWQKTVERIRSLLPLCEVAVALRSERSLAAWVPPRNPAKMQARFDALFKEVEASVERCRALQERMPQVVYPEALPISQRKDEILELIQKHSVVVIAGETGSGKTTQLPKICLDAGLGIRGKIACTQPRRIAALTVSQRVAEELKVPWGKEVGAKIRFTDKTDKHTRIKFLTDGMLLSEVQGDRVLSEYDTVIIDEAHERSLNIDFLLGYLKQLREQRPDLKIIITSATIDTHAFSEAFGNAPIIEVSGRVFPVDVEYRPLDTLLEDRGDVTYIDGAVAAVESLVQEYQRGDILVFFPAEKDIREARDKLNGRRLSRLEVHGLFGRLSAGDQQKVFARSNHRKVILATNIAETSLTIPGIRFVVDTGYARLSRYSANSRTQRLPIEAVSQSSANQRKGRCGRVEDGLCVRLYSEADFAKRVEYTPAEILRSNLAAVILRMMAFGLGEIESFPFIDPPHPRNIQAGYQLLVELGALTDRHVLTELGRKLAHLPVDPTVGRMILEAHKEHCLREVLAIAAGLSIQDPRERPEEKAGEADMMHRKFQDKSSDFMTLLNIWKAYHDETDRMSQGQLRKFCRSHFLSYMRMREWQDIHRQLERVLKDLSQFRTRDQDADYEAIHRSILTGLLSNCGQKVEGNHYRVARGRKAMLFPGSGLFDKKVSKAARKKKSGETTKADLKGNTPEWIMASEVVETSNVYARTVAGIDVNWLLQLGSHLVKHRYTEPGWDEQGERVTVKERSILLGLEVGMRRTSYVKVNPREATEIFIRNGLVEPGLKTRFKFLDHNRKVRAQAEGKLARMRQSSVWAIEERLQRFYEERIQNVGSANDLKAFLKSGDESALMVEEGELLGGMRLDGSMELYPEQVEMQGETRVLDYQYQPGEDVDGVTLQVPLHEFESINQATLDWLVPGYIEEKVDALLRALPKDLRRRLFPLNEKKEAIVSLLEPGNYSLPEALSIVVQKRYGIGIPSVVWDDAAIPEHLKVRLEVVNDQGKSIAAARSLQSLEDSVKDKIKDAAVKHREKKKKDTVWAQALEKWRRSPIETWDFGDPPLRVEVSQVGSVPVFGYPGLRKMDNGELEFTLLHSEEEADKATREALVILFGECLRYELAWLQKDLNDLKKIAPLCVHMMAPDVLIRDSYTCVLRHMYAADKVLPLKQAWFEEKQSYVRDFLKGWVPRWGDLLKEIFQLRQQLVMNQRGYPGMQEEVQQLVGNDFLRSNTYKQICEFPRYLKSMQRRADRYIQDPAKDRKKAEALSVFKKRCSEFAALKELPARARRELEALRWMLREYEVSVFAQELGTAFPISEKRVEKQFKKLRGILRPDTQVEFEKPKAPSVDLSSLKIGTSF